MIALFFFSLKIGYTAGGFPCTPAKNLMAATLHEGMAYLSTAISNRGFVVQFYINMRTGQWRILGVESSEDKKLTACIVLEGEDWQSALVRRG